MKTNWTASIREYEPLAHYTSWRIGGPARFYVEASTADELRAALHWHHEHDMPVLLLGGGTNLLIPDRGFEGLVIRYRQQNWHIEQRGDAGLLYAGAGVPIGNMVWKVGSDGWSGLEWAAGLPGTLGGAVYGNAGCYGGDIASVLRRAWLLVDDEVQEWSVERFEYAYRSSCLKYPMKTCIPPPATTNGKPAATTSTPHSTPPIILAAELHVTRADNAETIQAMRQIATERKTKTPAGSSCGSVFQNPSPTCSAGKLIDDAGLKGTRIGHAEISQRHANYIINLGSASSDDILHLIDLARHTVLRQFGIEMELEVQIVT